MKRNQCLLACLLVFCLCMTTGASANDSRTGKTPFIHLSNMEKLSRYLTLFGYVLNHPCEVCFENIPDTSYAVEINRDLQELRIDSLIIEENKNLPFNDKYRSKFAYVNGMLSALLGEISFAILLVTLIWACVYLYKIKSGIKAWAWKKNAKILLISLSVLLLLSFFTYLFSSDTIPIFGSSSKAITGDPKITNSTLLVSDAGNDYCVTDPTDTCINMPFPTLMIILSIGMLIGVLITRYLIMPLQRRNNLS